MEIYRAVLYRPTSGILARLYLAEWRATNERNQENKYNEWRDNKMRIQTMTREQALRLLTRPDKTPNPDDSEAIEIAIAALADVVADTPTPMEFDDAFDAAQDVRAWKVETVLNEAATWHLWVHRPRYTVTLTMREHRMVKDVPLHLFHKDRLSNFALKGLVVLNPDRTMDELSRSHVPGVIGDTFTEDEAKQLCAYYSKQEWVSKVDMKPANPPRNRHIGYSDRAVGGCDDFVTLDKDDQYTLPFKVWGYYNMQWVAIDREGKAESPDQAAAPQLSVFDIWSAVEEQAKNGSCKTCLWCWRFPEKDKAEWTHYCAVQGDDNPHPIWFRPDELDAAPYPKQCNVGCWGPDDNRCLAYQPGDDKERAEQGIYDAQLHEIWMRDLREAVMLDQTIDTDRLDNLRAELNDATWSLPASLRSGKPTQPSAGCTGDYGG